MVKIRLKRIGSRHRPSYRVVAIESERSRDGRYLESIGHYDPRTKNLQLDLERTKFWITKGARPSDTVKQLIRRYEKSQSPAGEASGPDPKPVSEMVAEAEEAAGIIAATAEAEVLKRDDMEAPAEMAIAESAEPDSPVEENPGPAKSDTEAPAPEADTAAPTE